MTALYNQKSIRSIQRINLIYFFITYLFYTYSHYKKKKKKKKKTEAISAFLNCWDSFKKRWYRLKRSIPTLFSPMLCNAVQQEKKKKKKKNPYSYLEFKIAIDRK